jgi:hypothetical protein
MRGNILVDRLPLKHEITEPLATLSDIFAHLPSLLPAYIDNSPSVDLCGCLRPGMAAYAIDVLGTQAAAMKSGNESP